MKTGHRAPLLLSSLYERVLAYYKSELLYNTAAEQPGLCICIRRALGSAYADKVKAHFLANEPTYWRHKEFSLNWSYRGSICVYWWPRNFDGNEQRIAFLKHLIEQCKREESNAKTNV